MLYRKINRSQNLMFVPTCIDDYAPSGSKPRFIVEIIESMDLNELYSKYSSKGSEAKDPAAMLATWVLAYSEGITSSRVLEAKCRRDHYYIYTSGDLEPDYSTLCRFRTTHIEFLPKVFLKVLEMANEQNLTDFKNIFTDGTKIQASCSKKQSKTSEELQKYLQAVRKDIAEYMKQCDQADAAEATQADRDKAKEAQEKLQEKQELEAKLLERQKQLDERKKELKKEHREKHRINITEPDARNMGGVSGNQLLPAYNTQVSVEGKNNFIVASDIVTDPNDQNQLATQIENVNENIGEDPERKSTLDAGYHTKEQLQYGEEEKLDIVVADPAPENRSTKTTPTPIDTILKEKDRKVQRADFVFHEEDDYYECPAHEKLEFKNAHKNGDITARVYEKPTPCHGCALFERCIDKKNKTGIKRIHRDDREYLAENMYEKLQTDEGKERMKKRRCTVEPAIGCLKHNMGFRRFNLRGQEKVTGEFLLMCLAYNINKLFKLIREMGQNPSSAQQNAQKSARDVREIAENIYFFLFLFNFIQKIHVENKFSF